MKVCPYCQHKVLEGMILCPECGASLIDPAAAQRSCTPAEEAAPGLATPPEETASSASTGRTTAHITPTMLRLLVLNSGRTIFCPMKEVLLIGRADASGSVFPEIDLNQDNAYMAGISRRHARIIRRGDAFFLEDLDSMNGSYLNRARLAPHTPVQFQDGDEIRLGNLVLRVILEEEQP